MRILFVDHVCHGLTGSADFFLDILRERFEVKVFRYERYYSCRLPGDLVDWADVIVYWEFLPSRFACGISGKRCVFVPMYDNEWGSKWLWRRLAHLGIHVVSFCGRVTDHARACGVRDVLDVRFAYDPGLFKGQAGDPRKVIVWERGGVDFATVKAIFDPRDIDKTIVMRRQEEAIRHVPISQEDMATYHVEIHRGGFLPKDDYLKLLSEPGVFVAPRLKEGIGMSFLEAMAMGKCVVGHCDATMDEYLVSGRNGIVVDLLHPRRIGADEIAMAQRGVGESARTCYERWLRDRQSISRFFETVAVAKPMGRLWSLYSILSYGLFLVEGSVMRMKGFVKLLSGRFNADTSR